MGVAPIPLSQFPSPLALLQAGGDAVAGPAGESAAKTASGLTGWFERILHAEEQPPGTVAMDFWDVALSAAGVLVTAAVFALVVYWVFKLRWPGRGGDAAAKPVASRVKVDFGLSGPDALMLLCIFVLVAQFLAPMVAQLMAVQAGLVTKTAEGVIEFTTQGRLFATFAHGALQLGFPLAFIFLMRRRWQANPERMAEQQAMTAPLPFLAGCWRLVPAYLAWALFFFGLMWLSLALTLYIEPMHEWRRQPVLEQFLAPSAWRNEAMIMMAVISAPIVEEFAFRATLQGWLRRHMAFLPAALITAAVFTTVHSPWRSPQITLSIVGLSMALSWVYERSRNIWYGAALHALHNGVVLLLTVDW